MGAYEARVATFAEAERQRMDLEAEQRRQQPSESEKHGMKMVVDAFGLRQTGQLDPSMQALHGAYVTAREEGVRPARTLERMPVQPSEQQRGLQRSPRNFTLVRDWDR
jgi:hypothetical protein